MSDHVLAAVFRRVLAEQHSLCGMELTIGDVMVTLNDDEWEVIWDTLDELDDGTQTVRLTEPAA